ncbi:MAG: hypothetical protein IKP22_00540, partial [Clostridia bacterium]|nr:hypothetical protein [Clostridia bacterium]
MAVSAVLHHGKALGIPQGNAAAVRPFGKQFADLPVLYAVYGHALPFAQVDLGGDLHVKQVQDVPKQAVHPVGAQRFQALFQLHADGGIGGGQQGGKALQGIAYRVAGPGKQALQ